MKFFRFQGLEISKPNVYNEIPTVGYQGFKSTYRPETVRINHRKDPAFNINALRPRLKEVLMEEAPEYAKVTDGFKRALSNKKYRETLTGVS